MLGSKQLRKQVFISQCRRKALMNISRALEPVSALLLASPTAVSWRTRLDLVAPGPGSLLAL